MFFLGGVEHALLTVVKQLHTDYLCYIVYSDEKSNAAMLERYEPYATVLSLDEAALDADYCICCARMKPAEFMQKIRAKKYYAWVHAVIFQTYPAFTYSEEFQDAMDKFICVSQSVKDSILGAYPALEEKCLVIQNYVDSAAVLALSEEPCRLEVDPAALNIITVARLSMEKGFNRVKALIDLFAARNIAYQWYVLGAAYKPEAEAEVKGLFAPEDRIAFLGYDPNPYRYIKRMDYLALLSDIESWGLAITEALALNVPCIATAFKEAYSQITDKNGIILPLDTHSYGTYIDRIIEKPFLFNGIPPIEANNRQALEGWRQIL